MLHTNDLHEREAAAGTPRLGLTRPDVPASKEKPELETGRVEQERQRQGKTEQGQGEQQEGQLAAAMLTETVLRLDQQGNQLEQNQRQGGKHGWEQQQHGQALVEQRLVQ